MESEIEPEGKAECKKAGTALEKPQLEVQEKEVNKLKSKLIIKSGITG